MVLKPESHIMALEERAFREISEKESKDKIDPPTSEEKAISEKENDAISRSQSSDISLPVSSHSGPSPAPSHTDPSPISTPLHSGPSHNDALLPSNSTAASSFEVREMEITDFNEVFQLGCTVFWDDEFWDDGEVVELFQTDSECCLVAQDDQSGAIIGVYSIIILRRHFIFSLFILAH